MKALLAVSGAIDRLNGQIGRWVIWLILASTLISAGNATVRKAFNMSSNALLEIQWYLYAAVFVLAAGYTLLRDEHVRIDVLGARLPPRVRAIVDLLGTLFFLLPFVVLITVLGWRFFWRAFVSGEMSSNFDGLIRWPIYLVIPVGFTLLGLQGVSEAIKRIAFIAGYGPDPGASARDDRQPAEGPDGAAAGEDRRDGPPAGTAGGQAPPAGPGDRHR